MQSPGSQQAISKQPASNQQAISKQSASNKQAISKQSASNKQAISKQQRRFDFHPGQMPDYFLPQPHQGV